MCFRYLDKERQRLQEARVRVQEQRRLLMGSLTPSGKITFTGNHPYSGEGLPSYSDYSRTYPNSYNNYNQGILTNADKKYIRGYLNGLDDGGISDLRLTRNKYGPGGGTPRLPWLRNTNTSPEGVTPRLPWLSNTNTATSVPPNRYYLVNGDTYKSDADMERNVEVCYKPKPFHVREMNCRNEYDVFVKEVPAKAKFNAKIYYDDGYNQKKIIKFKDIDKIRDVDKRPHLSTDLYNPEYVTPSSYTDLVNYTLPERTNYPWLPVLQSVFDSVENKRYNVPVIVPKPASVPERKQTPRAKIRFVPVPINSTTMKYKTWPKKGKRHKG